MTSNFTNNTSNYMVKQIDGGDKMSVHTNRDDEFDDLGIDWKISIHESQFQRLFLLN